MKSAKLGWLVIIFLSLIPLEIWASMQPISTRFVNLAVSMTSIGQLTALIGTVLLGITFLLSTRLKFIEYLFRGLDNAYNVHHILGTVSFLLILFHPIFLAVKYATFSINSAVFFLLPGSDWGINFGIFSLFSITLFLIFTFFINLKYDKWKLVHQFLGISLLLAVVHIFFISSDISRNIFLNIYVLSFVFLGVISFFYKTLFYQWLVKRYDYNIGGIRTMGSVTEIKLESKEPIKYNPGQFIFVSFPSISKEFHPFSITSSPEDKNLTIAVKSLGDYTNNVKNLKPGSAAKIEGPYGRFGSDKLNQIWVAGGIGITPFLSMAKNLKNKKVDLYYSVNDKKEAIFLEDFEKIAKKNKNFRVIPYYVNEMGFLNAKYINDQRNIKNQDIFICGPPAMMTSLKGGLINMGINKNKIYIENFQLL